MFGLFAKKDVTKAIGKIEKLFEKGYKGKAIEKAEALEKDANESELSTIRGLKRQIEASLIDEYLSKADAMVKKGCTDEAIEWMDMALDYISDPHQKKEVENQIQQLSVLEEEEDQPESEVAPEEMPTEAQDRDAYFETLINMLKDEYLESCQALPEAFQQAYVLSHSGQYRKALELLNSLSVEGDPVPMIEFEKARCLMALEAYGEARTVCEQVWDEFGNESIDLAEAVSIPVLWTECCLQQKDPVAIIEKVGELAAPRKGNPALTLLVSFAFEMDEQFEEAVDLLSRAIRRFDDPNFSYHLARILNDQGEWENAAQVLESAITPSCSGSCYGPPLHFPSLHMLIGIYLTDDRALEAAGKLLNEGDKKLMGRKSKEHLLLWSAYHEKTGNTEWAAKARTMAESAASGIGSGDTPQIEAGDQAVL
ncbi:MAG: hypothetical protein CR997_01735 [Acidobacteria bacterium]|nr:MAG: hypothetical protein CR997_01735 [Acidobacteriota bacterium]